MSYKEFLRKWCPDFLPLKKFLAKLKIRQYSRFLIPEDQVSLAETDDTIKKQTVNKYERKWEKHLQVIKEDIDNLFLTAPAYQNGADKEYLKTDMLFCWIAYGFKPNEYLCFGLEKRDEQGRREFVSDIDRWKYVYRLNDIVDYMTLGDKWDTYKKFGQYFKRDLIVINSSSDLEIFNDFIDKHPIFVKKQVLASRGVGVGVIDADNCGESREKLFNEILSEGKTILEELVVQSEELSKLNPSSVNTIRCAAMYTRHGIEIAFCFLRVGKAGAFVDNGSAGGIEVGIDMQTGILNTDGYDQYGVRYSAHPDTGISFIGYELPEWNKMLDICNELSSQLPTVKYICWDMAHTPAGWIVIEGNNAGQMMGPQIVYQKGIKSKIEDLIKDMDLLA